MTDKELVMKLEEDISWLEQGCTTEQEICDHIKQAIKAIIQHKETGNPWCTGTPTEEGWYFVAYKKRDCDGSYYWDYGVRVWIEIIEGEGHWNECQEKHPVAMWQRTDELEKD